MDEQGVREAIQGYFDAGDEINGDKMREVFYDIAHLYACGEDGELLAWDMDTFIGIMETNLPGYPPCNEIISIDFTSEDTAVARVKVRVMDTLYTDILSFIRLDGKWKVIAKVFAGVPV